MIDNEMAGIIGFAGIGLGALLAWAMLRTKAKAAWQHGHDEAEAAQVGTIATLRERASGLERDLAEAKTALEAARDRLDGAADERRADASLAAARRKLNSRLRSRTNPCLFSLPTRAPVAQLDRAPDYESGG